MKAWPVLMRRKWLFIPLGLLLVGTAALLATLLYDSAQRLLAWLVVAHQVAALYAETLPQPLLWALAVTIVLSILAGSLLGWQARPRPVREESRARQGPVRRWARLTGPTGPSAFRTYDRWRLAREVALLAAGVLSHTRRVSRAEAGRWLDSGTLEAPTAIRAYLRAGRADPPGMHFPHLLSFRRGKAPAPLALDPEEVIAFLEKELEAQSDVGDQPGRHDWAAGH